MRQMGVVLFLILTSLFAQAQTLLISDVDDTIKLANIQNKADAALYAFDDESRFMGMSELYNALAKEDPSLTVVYLSKAPEWLMKNTHIRFLANGAFPAGYYIGRKDLDANIHKRQMLQRLIEEVSPRRVILLGDNGEQDPQVYAQIAREYRAQGVEFHQFIRVVYPGAVLLKEQTGFVTPIEVALELEQERLLSTSSLEKLMKHLIPGLIKPNFVLAPVVTAFPAFVDCRDFVWKWDDRLERFDALKPLKAHILDRCSVSSRR